MTYLLHIILTMDHKRKFVLVKYANKKKNIFFDQSLYMNMYYSSFFYILEQDNATLSER